MRTKSLNKKLVLNKKTVANLDKMDMNTAKGGFDPYTNPLTCNTEKKICTQPVVCVNSFYVC